MCSKPWRCFGSLLEKQKLFLVLYFITGSALLHSIKQPETTKFLLLHWRSLRCGAGPEAQLVRLKSVLKFQQKRFAEEEEGRRKFKIVEIKMRI